MGEVLLYITFIAEYTGMQHVFASFLDHTAQNYSVPDDKCARLADISSSPENCQAKGPCSRPR